MWRWLFGIETAEDQIEGDLRFEWLSAPSNDAAFLLVVGCIAACVVVWLLYRWEASRLSPGIRAVLALLRLSIIGATVAMLCEPVAVLTKQVLNPSHLLVLVDTSESMNLKDAWKDSEAASNVTKSLELQEDITAVTRAALVDRAFKKGTGLQIDVVGSLAVGVYIDVNRIKIQLLSKRMDTNNPITTRGELFSQSLFECSIDQRGTGHSRDVLL